MKRDTKILIGFVAGVYLFFTLLRMFLFADMSFAWHLEAGVLGIVSLIIVATLMLSIDRVLDRFYPYDNSIPLRLFIQFAVSFIVIFTFRFVVFSFVRQIVPLKMSRELWVAATIIHILSISTLILTMFSYRFFNRWKETELKKEILEKEKATVQYDNLKNQLNPHFLFNSLTSLNSLIFENPQLASEFLQQLSRVYRYVLENKDKTLVSIATEIKFISSYVRLLTARFENGLVVNIRLDDETMARSILPVTLQILIENAIKHNTMSRDKPLVIDIYREGNYLAVMNNVQVKHTIETSNGQGLENLKNLYKVLIEKEVLIENSAGGFLVKVPLI